MPRWQQTSMKCAPFTADSAKSTPLLANIPTGNPHMWANPACRSGRWGDPNGNHMINHVNNKLSARLLQLLKQEGRRIVSMTKCLSVSTSSREKQKGDWSDGTRSNNKIVTYDGYHRGFSSRCWGQLNKSILCLVSPVTPAVVGNQFRYDRQKHPTMCLGEEKQVQRRRLAVLFVNLISSLWIVKWNMRKNFKIPSERKIIFFRAQHSQFGRPSPEKNLTVSQVKPIHKHVGRQNGRWCGWATGTHTHIRPSDNHCACPRLSDT